MTLRPFLLITACLLGACEKKDAAPGSHSPDIASTKSSLRDTDHESRDTRRERPAKTGAIESIDRLIRQMEQAIRIQHDQGEDDVLALQDAKAAIQSADPAEFDAIWRRLGAITDREFRETLQILAIYHLSAREDLVAAGVILRDLMLSGKGEGNGIMLLGALFTISDPTPVQVIAFLRQTESLTHRDMVSKFTPHNRFDREELMALRSVNPPITDEESSIIVGDLAGGLLNDFGDVLTHDDGTDAARRLEAIAFLEKQGVFPKRSQEIYLTRLGIAHPELFVKVVPREELQSYLLKPGYDHVIASIVVHETGGPSSEGLGKDVPEVFFTPTGIQNLPPEKTALALGAWHSTNPDGAEAWFAANAATFPQLQQDKARAGFARNTWDDDPSAARRWVDQISDPALRAKALTERHGEGN